MLLLPLLFDSCSKVPITGRRQVNLLPESIMTEMSLASYNDFLKTNTPVPSSDPKARQVEIIGRKISHAVGKYMRKNDMAKRLKNFSWEFNLVDDNTPNAWCMPGGKVVVYTGILPFTKDDEGLACVMGHEIAHAVARHGNERMSQQLMVTFGAIGLDVALREKPEQTKEIFNMAYGLGSTLGTLAYSRSHESEADKMGMIFMAMAGYDPSKSIGFWERMATGGGTSTPEFLSTHPSHKTRIADLKAFLPEAMKYYKK